MSAPEVKKPERAAKTRTGWMLLGIIGILVAGAFAYLYSESETRARRGAELVSEGRLAEASEAYAQALRRFPFKGSYYARIADIQEASGDAAAAAGTRKKARFLGAS